MGNATTPANPYEAPQLPACSDPLLETCDKTSTGGSVSTWCQFRILADSIELKFLTRKYRLPLAHVDGLASGGKGAWRYLTLRHHDPQVPATICITPFHPARWYDAFEKLGLPTEDEADFRDASQLVHRTADWSTTIEGLFWMGVFFASIAAAVISYLLG